jgi:hypothetical protein
MAGPVARRHGCHLSNSCSGLHLRIAMRLFVLAAIRGPPPNARKQVYGQSEAKCSANFISRQSHPDQKQDGTAHSNREPEPRCCCLANVHNRRPSGTPRPGRPGGQVCRHPGRRANEQPHIHALLLSLTAPTRPPEDLAIASSAIMGPTNQRHKRFTDSVDESLLWTGSLLPRMTRVSPTLHFLTSSRLHDWLVTCH